MEKKVNNERLAELVKNLPLPLRSGLRTEVLACAIEEKVIAITDDGRLQWLLESKTLQAYFCGRLWCGDTIQYNRHRRTYTWKRGRKAFPKRDIEALFAVQGLYHLRYHRDLLTPPIGYEIIDSLFDTADRLA